MNIVCGLVAFLVAAGISLLNGLNTCRILKKKNSNSNLFLVFALRQVINLGLLLAAFLLRNSFPVSPMFLLISTAIGIIVPTIILTVFFSKKLKAKP